ncbi:PTS system mannose/fructose/sorbose family transporter subunit IID [Pediococcus argentinicus]|uniref:PTS system, IID component n=1 Tax=Pediococcus argentinicus TaxID=480391 RepID=A0A0R2NI27_9LACO|nr:PTS system mannose/fructose/sorbose family transporter subunit IID [Pediococcus argentinicus]KRO25447.1 PTS system, IID component [Pediococcus argentinicus]NKZ22221.1 PTS system mannose/fructose/sorbose family transporter subunit IID [Pediococcus argentinicus]GEP19310.1 PTS N-acetylglucosamine transporter subunit IIABC [Pediococcus argentinicus]
MSKEKKQTPVNTPGVLTRKERHSAILRYMTMGVNNFNYETQQGPSVVWAFSKVLRKIYPKDDEYVEALDNHFKYFNTTTAMANIILGATLAMEEKDGIKSKDAVQSLKTSLMGPFAGIGDTIIWVLFPTIMGSIAGYMAVQGNPTGAIAWILFDMLLFWARIKLFDLGYNSGVKLITSLGERLSIFTEATSVMGLTVVGTLIATVVKVYTPLTFMTGKVKLAIQSGILDKIMPALLPALVAYMVYTLLGKKSWTPTKVILLIVVISLVGAFTGLLGVQPQ